MGKSSLIVQSSLPVSRIEDTFAPDGTRYSVSKFIQWQDEKFPEKRSGKDWVKIHLVAGVKTHIVTAAVIEGRDANDSPIMPELLEITKQNFTIKEWLADSGYLSVENYDKAFATGCLTKAIYELGIMPEFWKSHPVPPEEPEEAMDPGLTVQIPLRMPEPEPLKPREAAIINALPSYQEQLVEMLPEAFEEEMDARYCWV